MSINIQTSDNVIISMDASIIGFFKTIKNMLEDIGEIDGNTIPLPNVYSWQLETMISWAMHHVDSGTNIPESPMPTKEGMIRKCDHLDNEWNVEFAQRMSYRELRDLLLPANYLDFRTFYEFLCQSIAKFHFDEIAEMCYDRKETPVGIAKCDELMRKKYSELDPELFVDDLTPEEKNQLHTETTWCYNYGKFAPKKGYENKLVPKS